MGLVKTHFHPADYLQHPAGTTAAAAVKQAARQTDRLARLSVKNLLESARADGEEATRDTAYTQSEHRVLHDIEDGVLLELLRSAVLGRDPLHRCEMLQALHQVRDKIACSRSAF